MAGNTLTLEFAGDADKLKRAAREANTAVDSVAQASRDAASQFSDTAQEASRFEQRMGNLGAATSGLTDAVDSLGGGLQAVADIQDYARDRAQRLARANVDVMQAQEDYNQALRDSKQAAIDADQAEVDLEQARLDQKTALKDYNAAVKEHGRNSDEAKQASIDLKQAGVDVKQAQEDAAQATRDGTQANIDAKTAQVDLADAMHEAKPPELQGWADKLNLITPLLSALVGIVGLVTAAQWAFNASLLASPVTWIVLGIGVLIGAIVLLVKNWDKVKAAGGAAWRWVKDRASDAWGYVKQIPGWVADRFGKIGSAISRPFRNAFNQISFAWNNTVGRLSWSVPGWIPGIGGNSISVPNLPTFHKGGTVPGPPGTEVPILALAGETVLPPGGGGSGTTQVIVMLDSDVLIEGIARTVRRRGGNVQAVLGGRNA
ncbi:hypothetical protein AB0M02_44255 [Actinoplanes sp. NPDC051861]|uniref:hypothetical protein n=1 Tax=Actinoplanes sp. NPDC051861 TaxID=3155170 RepID=UPI003440C00A